MLQCYVHVVNRKPNQKPTIWGLYRLRPPIHGQIGDGLLLSLPHIGTLQMHLES